MSPFEISNNKIQHERERSRQLEININLKRRSEDATTNGGTIAPVRDSVHYYLFSIESSF